MSYPFTYKPRRADGSLHDPESDGCEIIVCGRDRVRLLYNGVQVCKFCDLADCVHYFYEEFSSE